MTKSKRHTGFRFRAVVSFVLMFASLVMVVSGILIYFSPKGRDASLLGWRRLGWDRQEWVDVHITSCVLFLILGTVHVYYNRRILWGYVYSKTRRRFNLWKELLIAIGLTAIVLVGTVCPCPPMSTIVQWRQEWKHGYSAPGPRAMRDRNEKASPADLAWRIGVPLDKVLESLRKEGYRIDDAKRPLPALASDNGVSAAEMYASLARSYPDLERLDGSGGRGHAPGNRPPWSGRGGGYRGGRGRGSQGAGGRGPQGPGAGRER